MREFKLSKKIERTLKKLGKKDKLLFRRCLDKIDEISECYDVENYKNLKKPMQECKRAHLGSFDLIFRYNKKDDFLHFEDLDHHDFVYKNK